MLTQGLTQMFKSISLKEGALVLGVAAFMISACGKDEQLSYEYEVNGCKTGRHTFKTKEEYCQTLQQQSSNNGCAENIRKDSFKRENCEGSFLLRD